MAEYLKRKKTKYIAWNKWKCNTAQCEFEATHGRELLSHYSKEHRFDKSFQSKCLFNEHCFYHSSKEFFTSFYSLYQHLKEYHESFFVNFTVSGKQSDSNVSTSHDIPVGSVEEISNVGPIPCLGISLIIFNGNYCSHVNTTN